MSNNASPPLSGTLFRDLAAGTVRGIVLAASDMALLLDADGVVRDLVFRSDGLRDELGPCGDWLGRPWRATMTVESRPKLDAMLADARAGRPIRWRQLNHPSGDGSDLAISWSAVPSGGDTIILLGRDLRQTAALQQRLVETQQFLERDYLALRRTEARYRTLFETARDGIAVLDASSLRAVELNPAARRLLGRDARRALTKPFAECFDSAPGRNQGTGLGSALGADLGAGLAVNQAVIAELLAAARAGQQPDPVSAILNNRRVRLAVSGLREEDGWFLLARMSPEDAPAIEPPPGIEVAPLTDLLSLMPDPAVLTDESGNVVATNDAFRTLAGLAPEQPVIGEPLSRWIGRDGVDLSVLISNLQQRGVVRLFATEAHGEGGVRTAVEISASRRPGAAGTSGGAGANQGGGGRGFAFYLRDVGRRPAPTDRPPNTPTQAAPRTATPRPADGMGALIGRVPLKELVRESTDAIERMCIERALEMTNNNRASAAEMLGLSRQSLYVKLRRFGLVEADATEASGGDPP